MAVLELFVLLLLFQNGATLPTLCNNQKFDDHRYLYGQASVSCHVFRPGTCLVIGPEKVDISIAQMECTYKYGGQLVVPKDAKDVIAIRKHVYFHHSVPADYADSKFFLGLIGNQDYGDLRVDALDYRNTLDIDLWWRVMMLPFTGRIKRSDYPFADGQRQLLSNEKVHQPAVGTCVDKVIGLNPTTAKFEVLNGKDKHYYLCETPRWPKYNCPEGYLLDRSQRMCYKAYSGKWNFIDARKKCRAEKSVIGISKLVLLPGETWSKQVFLHYLLNSDPKIIPGVYLTAIITNGDYHFCDDGSYCDFTCNGLPDGGFALHLVSKRGFSDKNYDENSFCYPMNSASEARRMTYGVICSVRPDQTKTLSFSGVYE